MKRLLTLIALGTALVGCASQPAEETVSKEGLSKAKAKFETGTDTAKGANPTNNESSQKASSDQ